MDQITVGEHALRYQRVEANGLSFHVAVAGSGDRLVLCLHGFPESAISWRHQMDPIAQAGYRVWAPDLRGYAGTSRPPGIEAYGIERLMDDVTALIDAAGEGRAILVGHDWGGVIAWYTAMRHPERLDALVVLNAPHPACFDREVRRWRQLRRILYMGLFQLPWLPEALLGAGQGRAIGKIFQAMTVNRERLSEDALRLYCRQVSQSGALTAMLNYYRAAARGGGAARQRQLGYPIVEVPTLVLWGLQDRGLVSQNLDGLEALVNHLTVVRIGSAGHFVQQDEPVQVTREILDWLPRHQPVPG